MKVAYFIYSGTTGLGGHYRSLDTLLSNWGQHDSLDYELYNLGINPSPVLIDNAKYTFYPSSLFALPLTLIKLIISIKRKKIEILHAYDSTSNFIVRIISFFLKIKSVYTKCGGSNALYAPKCKDSIVFSKENEEFLRSRNPNGNYYFIPNRINLPVLNLPLIDMLASKLEVDDNVKVVMRIGNITRYYKKSLESAFEFCKRHHDSFGDQTLLVIIGSELDNTLNDLKATYGDVRYVLLNDLLYTKNASSLLGLADYVIGTGRGAMEALGLGKKVYVSTANSDIPVEVTASNFLQFLQYNFSERSTITDGSNRITDENNKEELISLFNEFCLSSTGNKKILDLYNNLLISEPRSVFYGQDFIANFYKYLKNNLPFKDGLKKFYNKISTHG